MQMHFIREVYRTNWQRLTNPPYCCLFTKKRFRFCLFHANFEQRLFCEDSLMAHFEIQYLPHFFIDSRLVQGHLASIITLSQLFSSVTIHPQFQGHLLTKDTAHLECSTRLSIVERIWWWKDLVHKLIYPVQVLKRLNQFSGTRVGQTGNIHIF